MVPTLAKTLKDLVMCKKESGGYITQKQLCKHYMAWGIWENPYTHAPRWCNFDLSSIWKDPRKVIRDAHGHMKFKSVLHIKSTISSPEKFDWVYESNYPGFLVNRGAVCYIKPFCYEVGQYQHWPSADNVQEFLLTDYEFTNLCQYAIKKMKPSLSQISMPNFIYELKDFKTLFSFFGAAKELVLGQNPFKLIKALNGQFLNYNFGWKPFIKDCQALQKCIKEYKDALEEFKAGQKKIQMRHFKMKVVRPKRTVVFAQSSWTGNGSYKSEYTVEPYEIILRAHMQYGYTCLEIDNKIKEVQNVLDYFGVVFNPAIIWNMIPFSFVVDWVVNMGQFLDQLKIDTAPVILDIRDFCMSQSVKTYVDTQHHAESWDPGNKMKHTAYRYLKIYLRQAFLPEESFFLPFMGDLNIKEMILGGSLLYQLFGKEK